MSVLNTLVVPQVPLGCVGVIWESREMERSIGCSLSWEAERLRRGHSVASLEKYG